MHIRNLVDILKQELEGILLYPYESKNQEAKIPVKVSARWTTRKLTKEDFPRVLISPVGENVAGEKTTLSVYFVVGVYTQNDEGWRDVVSIIDSIRSHLYSHYTVGDGSFVFDREKFETYYPDEQPWPQWWGYVRADFTGFTYTYDGEEEEIEKI